jgi:hypothetical protein
VGDEPRVLADLHGVRDLLGRLRGRRGRGCQQDQASYEEVLAELLTALAMLGGEPAPPAPAVVWAVGDGANGTTAAKRLATTIRRDRPDRFLYLGDVYDRGTRAEFARNYEPVYGALATRTAPTPGNHEWGNRATGYFPYWRRKLGRSIDPWYAFDLGGWRVLSLNSEAPHGPGSEQLRWLTRELEGATGDCRIAFWHRPRFSAGAVHGDARDIAPLWDAVEGRAALVLGAHDHNSQRFRRRGGTVELVAGAGGPNLYGVRRDRRLVWSDDDNVAAVRIELTADRARFEFRTAAGRVLERGAVRCSAT